MKLCLLVGALILPFSGERATLAWTHSVEKIPWEEDWRATEAGVVIEAARVSGSGAGMEAGEGARFVDGVWQWRPKVAPQGRVILARSGATADWRICEDGRCRAMAEILPVEVDRVEFATCDDEGRLRDAGGTASPSPRR
ncbi:MAG: DUF1850 domain-containing protein [Hyphomicrobiales bacterium]|nr:DUF1850 domain-containing protein [Hyphomicrobiales bacterium]